MKPEDLQDRQKLEQLEPDKLVELVLELQKALQSQNDLIEKLRSQLDQDSQTSSQPPSSDLPKRAEKAQSSNETESSPETEPQQRRRPGGQPGHQGKTRKGFGRVDRQETHELETCPHCGGHHFESSGRWYRRQTVAELVEKPIEITEHWQECGHCADCGQKVQAALPADVIPGQSLGARLQATLGWLGHYGHLSYSKQQEWLREIGGIEISTGSLQATTRRLASAIEPAKEKLQAWVRQQPQVQVDETPWLVNGLKEWFWSVSGEKFCLFHAGDTRSRGELEFLLGRSFAGTLVSDDFSVYNGYQAASQQKCLAHLLRHFQKVARLKQPDQVALAEVFLALLREAFDQHRLYRQQGDRALYAHWAEDFKSRLQQALEEWRPRAGYAAGLLLKSLREKAHQWWYFLDHPEVPPDNNRAERSLRLGVTKRKVSGGSRSMAGFADTATLMTAIQSCRAQGRSVMAGFRLALQAVSHPELTFSLIPVPSVNPSI